MASHVNVNRRTVVHAGSGGVVMGFPDVCKTPSPVGPVPIPYANVARSADAAGGSPSVKAKGNPVMLQGSCFATSTGDEAGTAGGGVVSNAVRGKAEFVNYSFDVRFDGRPVARLGDLMVQNKLSSPNVPPAPEIQAALATGPGSAGDEDDEENAIEEVDFAGPPGGGCEQEQWVNVEPRPEFVEDEISSIERLGTTLKIRARFAKVTLAHFKLRVTRAGDHASYSEQELGRNPSFRLRTIGSALKQVGEEVELTRELALPCAGGNRFRIEGTYRGKTVTGTTTLVARRRLYYQVLSMKGVSPHPVDAMERYFWSPDKGFCVRLKEKGPRDEIAAIRFVRGDLRELLAAVRSRYRLEGRRPYAFTLVFCHDIVSPVEYRLKADHELEVPGARGGEPPAVALELAHHVWWGFDAADDAARLFLVENSTVFLGEDGTRTRIPDSAFSVMGPPDHPEGGYRMLRVDLSRVAQGPPATRKGKLRVDAIVKVAGWSHGFSCKDVNLVVVASHARWQRIGARAREHALRHEIGHKLGMVAAGHSPLAEDPFRPLQPDGPSALYGDRPEVNDRGHKGSHCGKGASWSARSERWSGAPSCVMFGGDGAWSSAGFHRAPDEFCPECARIVRKLDLDPDHLRGFRRSVMDPL